MSEVSIISAGEHVLVEETLGARECSPLSVVCDACDDLDNARVAALWLVIANGGRRWRPMGTSSPKTAPDFWRDAALARRVAECVGTADAAVLALAAPMWLDLETGISHPADAAGRLPTLAVCSVARGCEPRAFLTQAGLGPDGRRTPWASRPAADDDALVRWLRLLLLGGALIGLADIGGDGGARD